jgi:hypothetical protein
MLRKFRFYEKYGVEEYYIYDPDSGDLQGWHRSDGGLEEITDLRGYVSPRLGIRFEPGEGPDNLLILGSDGEPFATHQQLADRVRIEQQRAETARQHAETARQRAEQLAAKLRNLGIEPD